MPLLYKAKAAQKTRSGVTLMELAISLGIMAIIVGGVFGAYGAISEKNKLNQAVDDVRQVMDSQRSFYNRMGISAGGFPACAAMPLGAAFFIAPPEETFPQSMIFGADVRNVWNIGLALTSAQVGRCRLNIGGAPRDHFIIRFSRIPRQACAKLVSATTEHAADTGLSRVVISGGAGAATFDTIPVFAAANQLQANGVVNFQTAYAACNNNSVIDWFYRVGL